MVMGGSLLVLKAGRYKTCTLNSGLDYPDWTRLWTRFWTEAHVLELFRASHCPIIGLVPKIRFLYAFLQRIW